MLMFWPPESRAYQGQALPMGESTRELLGERRGFSTLLLWCSCFCTLTILYMLLNWLPTLPTLLIERGLSRLDTTAIQVLFNIGGVTGSLLAGQLLAAGAGVSGLLLAVSPLVAVAAVSAAALLSRDSQGLPAIS